MLLHLSCLAAWQLGSSPELGDDSRHSPGGFAQSLAFMHGGLLLCLLLVLVAQLCPTLCDPMDDSPPGSSVYGSLQVRILAWVAIPFSRGSSPPRDWTQLSCVEGRFSTIGVTREGLACSSYPWIQPKRSKLPRLDGCSLVVGREE